MSQKIQVGRFNQILGRSLTMGGQEDPAGDLSAEISPVLVLENDRPEWEYLGGGRLMAGSRGVAGAATPVSIRFRNPVGSGAICVLLSVNVSTGPGLVANDEYQAALVAATVDLASVGTTQTARDTRNPTTKGVAILSAAQAAVAGTNMMEDWFQPVSSNRLLANMPCIVSPGFALDVGSFTNSAAGVMIVSFSWRERAFQPFEA